LLSHLYSLHDPLIHVPLILRGPGVPRGRSTRHLVQSQDIFGTVLAAAGMPLPAGARNLLDDSSSRSYVVAEYAQPRMPRQELLDRFQLSPSHFTPFLRNLTAVRTQEHKLVTSADGTLALYDLIQDPEEQIDRSLEQPALLATLQGKLAEWRASVGLALPPAAAAPAIAPEVAARLKALGYLD
jgi:arylsulfatase A-like enzyme